MGFETLARRRSVHLNQVPVISIVDDDASIRVATENLVRSLGYIALVYPSAEEFLRSSRIGEIACLISDVQMPEMNGLELQDELRQRGLRFPIIFITAFPNPSAEGRALKGGAICFLRKPFRARDLINHLETALKTQSP
jgi:FixJ family two-component response regulator